MTKNKQYLGDGVYIGEDEYGLVLTTENGVQATNTIYLEPPVYAALMAYLIAHVEKWRAPAPPAEQEAHNDFE